MKCPIDNADLVMTERAGIEIDYCPQCRGVWLDRGELDKVIERSAAAAPAPAPAPPRPAPAYAPEPYARPDEDRWRGRPYDQRRHKKKSFLGELFDFD